MSPQHGVRHKLILVCQLLRRFDFAMARPERPLNITNAVSVRISLPCSVWMTYVKCRASGSLKTSPCESHAVNRYFQADQSIRPAPSRFSGTIGTLITIPDRCYDNSSQSVQFRQYLLTGYAQSF